MQIPLLLRQPPLYADDEQDINHLSLITSAIEVHGIPQHQPKQCYRHASHRYRSACIKCDVIDVLGFGRISCQQCEKFHCI